MTKILCINCVSDQCLWKTGNFPDSSGPRQWKCCSCCELPPTEESSHALPLSWGPGLCWGHPQATGLVMLTPRGWRGCKTTGVPCIMSMSALWGQPARGKAGTGTTVGPAMPWIHKESPQPLTRDQLGFPPGMEVRAKTESAAAWLAQQPAATHSTLKHPAAP